MQYVRAFKAALNLQNIFPLSLHSLSSSTLCVAQAVVLPDHWESGYPDGPEMNNYKQQLQQFVNEWEQMQPALPVANSVLEIGSKSPEDLLQEMILHIESESNPVKLWFVV